MQVGASRRHRGPTPGADSPSPQVRPGKADFAAALRGSRSLRVVTGPARPTAGRRLPTVAVPVPMRVPSMAASSTNEANGREGLAAWSTQDVPRRARCGPLQTLCVPLLTQGSWTSPQMLFPRHQALATGDPSFRRRDSSSLPSRASTGPPAEWQSDLTALQLLQEAEFAGRRMLIRHTRAAAYRRPGTRGRCRPRRSATG
jgi:hypothetical protein